MSKKIGKRLRAIREGLDTLRLYEPSEAVNLIKQKATAKFDETVELAVNLRIDPKKTDHKIRGMVQLPEGTGKDVRVAVFARGEKATEASSAGADVVFDENSVSDIQNGTIALNFETCIATPDMMGVVGTLGRILGPRGLMPNPKLGTVTNNIQEAIKAAKGGQVEYRTEKAGVVHVRVGKASFSADALLNNIKALLTAVIKAKPAGIKSSFINSVFVSSTMGPAVRINCSDLLGNEK